MQVDCSRGLEDYLSSFTFALKAAKMHQKLLKSAHYIELGSYQYWPVLVPRGIRLYTYEQIPVFLKDNPYITDGYRAYLPSRLCLKRYRVGLSVIQMFKTV